MNQSLVGERLKRFRIASILLWMLLVVAQALSSAALASEPAPSTPKHSIVAAAAVSAPGPRNDLPGLKNFADVSPTLSRGAQPTHEGFVTLKSRGVKTIVNLRSEKSDRALLAGTGLRYVEIPCDPWHISDAEVAGFLKIAGNPRNQPVFVHCGYGSDRTGAMVGAYREMQQHQSADDVIGELRRFGYHSTFMQITRYLKTFNPAAIRAKVDAAPTPKVEVIH